MTGPTVVDHGPDPLRVVQVGAGGMGRAWLGALTRSPDTELVGLVDLDLDTARAAADEAGWAGVPVARSVAELTGARPEAVVNVTVPQAHHPVSTAALLAGLPVLCEKPLAESVAEGLSMVATAERSGQLLMVSQSRRYWRQVHALRRQLTRLGPIGRLSCAFARAPRFGGFREEMAYPLVVDMAIHQFDLARMLTGTDPVSVFCESFNPSWSWYAGDAAAVAIFELADGVRFTFDGSWCSPGLETSWNGEWRISAADGTAFWNGDDAPVAETAQGEGIPAEIGDEPEQIDGSLAEFVHAVRSGSTPQGEVHSNVISLAMVEAAVRSAETGTRVMITDVLEAAYAEAVRTETRPAVREVLRSWPPVHEALTASWGRR